MKRKINYFRESKKEKKKEKRKRRDEHRQIPITRAIFLEGKIFYEKFPWVGKSIFFWESSGESLDTRFKTARLIYSRFLCILLSYFTLCNNKKKQILHSHVFWPKINPRCYMFLLCKIIIDSNNDRDVILFIPSFLYK